MSLTLEEVQKIAYLSRIEISDEVAESTVVQLNDIFHTLIEPMLAVDTKGVEPMSHAQSISLRLREDVVIQTDCRDALQAIAPEAEKGLYLVPKVVE